LPRVFISSVPFDIRNENLYRSAAWHKMYKRKNMLIFATSDEYRPKGDAAIETMLDGWQSGTWDKIDLRSPRRKAKQSE